MTVQLRALRGDLGKLWMLTTYILAINTLVVTTILFSEIFKDHIERVLVSNGMYYYRFKEILNKLFFVKHIITINLILYLRSQRVCDKDIDTSIFDKNYCNSAPGIPLDTFSMEMFIAILCQSLLGLPYTYIFSAQVIGFFVLILIAYSTASIKTFPLSSLIIVMYLGVSCIQFYMQLTAIHSFIMDDKIKSYNSYSSIRTIQTSRSLNEIYYHNESPHKSAYSDSKINYFDDFGDYENRSTSSTLTSLQSSII